MKYSYNILETEETPSRKRKQSKGKAMTGTVSVAKDNCDYLCLVKH